MYRLIIQKNLLRNSKNYFLCKRGLLTPVDHIERTDINILPFFLVMSITAGIWGWESYQNLRELKNRVESFQDVLQKCLQDNQSCDYVETKLNSLFESRDTHEKRSMLVRVNTESHTNLEITRQIKPPFGLPFGIDETEQNK